MAKRQRHAHHTELPRRSWALRWTGAGRSPHIPSNPPTESPSRAVANHVVYGSYRRVPFPFQLTPKLNRCCSSIIVCSPRLPITMPYAPGGCDGLCDAMRIRTNRRPPRSRVQNPRPGSLSLLPVVAVMILCYACAARIAPQSLSFGIRIGRAPGLPGRIARTLRLRGSGRRSTLGILNARTHAVLPRVVSLRASLTRPHRRRVPIDTTE